MKKSLLLLLLTVSVVSASLFAQAFNTTLRDQLSYTANLNDVWGYVDTSDNNTEYALVGLTNGLSIVSLADPDDIEQVAFFSGPTSTWRDIKTYGEYAYTIADRGTEGLVITDLSSLPASASSQAYNLVVPGVGTLQRAHNLYIDVPTGLVYIAGSNLNAGGMIIFDVATTPGQAIYVGTAPNVYAHDVYVQDGLMHASEINRGLLTIYDVSDPAAIFEVGSTTTPNNFTHNAWTTADGNYVFTTDERSNSFTAAYDISDPSDPEEVDRFQPRRSVGSGTIPHNVHVLNEYLIISHYTDGVEIVDASVPGNLVEVGYYDSWSGADGGFNGSWGAYPFLPSGLVLSSDISGGLIVFEVDYKRGARIKGTVTEGTLNGPNLNNVTITISSTEADNTTTNAAGFYQNGIATAGTYTVTMSKGGYTDVVVDLDFQNGLEIVLDTFMTLSTSQVSIQADVTSSLGNAAISNAEVILIGENGSYTGTTDQNGELSLNNVFVGQYEAYVGKWGFENQLFTVDVQAGNNPSFQLQPGYLDGFAIDQGWTTSSSSNPSTGFWELGVPNGTVFNNQPSQAGADVDGGTDIGNQAYVTGNSTSSGAGDDDIDGGNVILTSPLIDFSIFTFTTSEYEISYDYWFFNDGGDGNPLDEMTVVLDNGSTSVTLATYSLAETNTVSSAWTPASIIVSNLTIPITNTMRLIVTAGDTGSGHIMEAGFDNFSIQPVAVLPVELTTFTARANGTQSVQLNWETAREINNDYFVIEHSVDGRSFTPIGRVNGAGNSTSPLAYSFTDDQPVIGENHYRLRQLDFDDTETVSDIRIVTFGRESTEEVVVFPNPTSEFIHFNQDVSGSVIIYRADGSLVGVRQLEAGQRLDVSQLPAGSYWLRVKEQVVSFVKG